MTELHVKTVPAALKSVDAEQGIVTSIRAVFGNVDAQNDRILPGAFTRTIAAWRAKMAAGTFMPVVYGHRDDPDFTVGKVLALEQTDEGLQTTEQYFLGRSKARAAFDNIREGVLPGGSFGYAVRKSKRASDGVQELHELDLLEVGPTLYPANEATRLVGVKADLDSSTWDANRAMGECSSAADYRSICAGERSVGEPDQRQHWALPHHYLGRPANAGGVAAARQRFDATEGLTNAAAARTHLFETHRLPSDEAKSEAPLEVDDAADAAAWRAFKQAIGVEIDKKVGRRHSARTIQQIRDAIAALTQLLDTEEETDAVQAGKAEGPDEVQAEDPHKAGIRADMEAELATYEGSTNAA